MVRAGDLNYPVDRMLPRKSLVLRSAARHVAAMILNHESLRFEVTGLAIRNQGPKEVVKPRLEQILIDKEEIAHWILYVAGYSCTVDQLRHLRMLDSTSVDK
jgi:hypothetical protein